MMSKSCSAFGCLVLLGMAACDDTGSRATAPAADIEFDAATKRRISVSGISAGAYMAVQTHVAYADRIGGVAAVAGGPYHCAEGSVKGALARCLTGEGLDVEASIEFAVEAAAAGSIAAVEDLKSSRVWIFHSPLDSVVAPELGRALRDFYIAFVPSTQTVLVEDVETAHGWPTLDNGADCLEWGGAYINDCDYDTAGVLLGHLYGTLRARASNAVPENLVTLDLSPYFDSAADVADAGFVYAPARCRQAGAECGMHIVFHGCRQGAEFVDDRFVTQAGFNEWAESNDLVVVYPQVEKSLFNPQGCWDWWGYTDAGYDLRSGKQVQGVSAVIDAFVSGTLLWEPAVSK